VSRWPDRDAIGRRSGAARPGCTHPDRSIRPRMQLLVVLNSLGLYRSDCQTVTH